ncbi:MAG: methylmalonyl-CoA decarboxylase [Deltaproteobacteria bacterium]|nr:methylmalonyl-CoA decarboxylase [Deltaproteobacteria bacterium]
MEPISESLIIKEVKETIGFITINNPRKYNALCATLLKQLIAVLEEFKTANIPVVVIRAPEGAKVWSAGHDISELPKTHRDPLGYENPLEIALRAVEEYPGPVIAMVHGSVWGGACDFVITCDMIIGDPSCSFAITPVKIGIPYNASGIMHFINRVGMNIAKEMFFSAQPVDAFRAEQIGILNHLVPIDSLESFTLDFAKTIASQSSLSIAVIKEQFRILAESHPITPYAFEKIQSLRRKVYDSRDYEEGITAFLEKRKPEFRGE